MKSARIKNEEHQRAIVNWVPDLLVQPDIGDAYASGNTKPSVFSDDKWDLCRNAGKSTLSKRSVSFSSSPERHKDSLKRLVWCMLNIEVPIHLIERPNASRTRLTIGSAVSHFESELRPFFRWMEGVGINSLSQLDEKSLNSYGNEISKSGLSRSSKARRLWGPTKIWLFAPYLPSSDRIIQPPWDRHGATDILGAANWSAENKTSPIHPHTMSPLIHWAIRFVTDFSPEITSAIREKAGMTSAYRTGVKAGDKERLTTYLNHRASIPAISRKMGETEAALRYIAIKADVGRNLLTRNSLTKSLPKSLGCPLGANISAKINGNPWVPYIDFYEVELHRQNLVAACIIVIAYLSGMRAEECRALKRGCSKVVNIPGGGVRYEIYGLTFKNALDHRGNSIHGGIVRAHPWHVVEPVHRAISVMESLHDEENLFSETALNFSLVNNRNMVLTTTAISNRLKTFVSWCNSVCEVHRAGSLRILEDPNGAITLSRFRRTLAWFIYRLPGGRVSLGIQYGHLRGITTDGYGARASTGLRDVFPMEEAYALADSLRMAAERLNDGEAVSGPSAGRYMAGLLEFSQSYQGRYITIRQASELRRNPKLRIFDSGNQPVACCYDSTRALCNINRTTKNSLTSTPDLTRCDTNCGNVARTDTHIRSIEAEVAWNELQISSKLTPQPLKERLLSRIERLNAIIRDHREFGRNVDVLKS